MRPWEAADHKAVTALRVLAIDQVEAANSGHPGLPLGAAPMAWVLWSRFLTHAPQAPTWPDRDRFVLSAGHGSALLYALLHLFGYHLPLDELRRFRQWGSRTPGHPEYGLTPGVETTTGPLGQGFANAVGMALAERHLAERFNRPDYPIIDHRTWVLASDGDLQEGVAHEAAALAGHLRLGRLVVLWDDNRITIEGDTSLAWSEDVPARFRALGWRTFEVDDGNDLEAIAVALRAATSSEEAPALVRVRTQIGFGSPHKQGSAEAHGAPLGEKEARLTRRALGWPDEEPFAIPAEVYAHAAACAERGRQAHRAWAALAAGYAAAYPREAAELQRRLSGALPPGWEDALPAFADAQPMATRQASGAVLNALAPVIPELLGGSADLAPSNNSRIAGEESVRAGHWGGRNVHFGVREHAMAAICNGLSLHGGVRPYAATFLMFADYLRPALRLAALMHQPVIYLFTHDSVAVGEDGPTHQPVEHLAALRAIPNLVVLRPADAHETREAWRVALARRDGPTALILTRQKLPSLPAPPAGAVARGAFVRAEAGTGEPAVTLLASGSEVALTLAARAALEAEGIAARVVSMPSWELFAAQDPEYRRQVLGPSGALRVAVEMGRGLGWERWVEGGLVVSIERFGASAPGEEVAQRFGFSPEELVARLRRALAERRPAPISVAMPATLAGLVTGRRARLESLHATPRLSSRDASLWPKGQLKGCAAPPAWLDLPSRTRRQLPRLETLAAHLAAEGARTLYVAGLGPATLTARAFRQLFGTPAGRQLVVVDTLEPSSVATVLDAMAPRDSALLAIAGPGDGEEGSVALAEILWERLAGGLGEGAGRRAVAIGEHGSQLERMALERRFAAFLPLPADATARFAAHGPAGMLPAAWLGVDGDRLLATAERATDVSSDHPAVALAALLAAVAEPGWGWLAWCASPALQPLGVWVEQLVAGATGKEGRGVLPLSPLFPPAPAQARPHTLFLSPRFEDEDSTALDRSLDALAAAGHPVVRWPLRRCDLGGVFMTLELATALAALLLGVNPFLEAVPRTRGRRSPNRSHRGLWRPAPARWETLEAHLARCGYTKAVALIAYLPERQEIWQGLAALAARVEQHARVPVSFGFAPRHTLAWGLLLPRGPADLVPVFLTAEPEAHLPTLGRRVNLTDLYRAYALNDLGTLVKSGRAVLHLDLGEAPLAALRELAG